MSLILALKILFNCAMRLKIDAPTSWGCRKEEYRSILNRAHELGYASQAHWTEKGLETLRNLARSFEPVKIKGYTIVLMSIGWSGNCVMKYPAHVENIIHLNKPLKMRKKADLICSKPART